MRAQACVATLALGLASLACRQDMHDQPRYKPLAGSAFFTDGRSARPLVPGTVARGHLRDDPRFYEGKEGGAFVETFPLPVDLALVRRGRERFDIFCAPCHGRTGRGDGMVVRRGYRRPPSLHVDRLRAAPVGHLYDVITNGFKDTPAFATQIPARDRWAIVAYLRALQLSQHAGLSDVPQDKRAELERPAGTEASEQHP